MPIQAANCTEGRVVERCRAGDGRLTVYQDHHIIRLTIEVEVAENEQPFSYIQAPRV